MKNIQKFFFLFLLANFTGCAMDRDLRKDTKFLSIYVEKVKSNADEFVTARKLVTQARISNLEFLKRKTLFIEQNIQAELSAREVAQDKEWITLFESVRKAPTLLQKQRQEYKDKEEESVASFQKINSTVNINTDKLTEISSTLATLSEKKPFREDIEFFIDFLYQVSNKIEKETESATASAEETAVAIQSKSTDARKEMICLTTGDPKCPK